jgi:Cu-Zn family superoxide dismutase
VVLGLIAVTAPTAAAVQSPLSTISAGVALMSGTFGDYTPQARAMTYEPSLVPVGSEAVTLDLSGPHGTTVALSVKGLVPERAYGAHVHTRPCGPSPADSGPHFQNVPDPHQPSTDPAYANPSNEVWLDFTTDAHGNALTLSTVDWTFAGRAASSVVIHERHTHTGDGQAGTAGARLACLNADFK